MCWNAIYEFEMNLLSVRSIFQSAPGPAFVPDHIQIVQDFVVTFYLIIRRN